MWVSNVALNAAQSFFVKYGAQTNKPAPEESLAVVPQIDTHGDRFIKRTRSVTGFLKGDTAPIGFSNSSTH